MKLVELRKRLRDLGLSEDEIRAELYQYHADGRGNLLRVITAPAASSEAAQILMAEGGLLFDKDNGDRWELTASEEKRLEYLKEEIEGVENLLQSGLKDEALSGAISVFRSLLGFISFSREQDSTRFDWIEESLQDKAAGE